MQVHTVRLPSATVLEVRGRLDASTASTMKQWVKQVSIQEPVHSLIIDLSQVHFLDTAGAGALRCSLKLCRGNFFLCGLPQPVQNFLDITQKGCSFEYFASRDEALREDQARRSLETERQLIDR